LELARARTAGRPFHEQVAEIAGLLDDDGYLADFELRPDGTYLIREHNCAVLGVALRYRHACSSELDFLQAALPDADVTRVAHRIAGGHVCAYEVRRRDGGTA
jgi:predicted ArsR family transcriptional regulator